jgi:hypothetical protein
MPIGDARLKSALRGAGVTSRCRCRSTFRVTPCPVIPGQLALTGTWTAVKHDFGTVLRWRNSLAGTISGGLMTACTQPRCTGTIVDGYCNICGSPAAAAPFVPAASAASARISTDCAQPGCTGTIVDGYCDVCGSPAVAAPLISTAAAASAASSTPVDGPGLTAAPASTLASGPADQEILTQRIPRGKTLGHQVSTQDMTDPGAPGPGAVDARQAGGEKELAQDEPDRPHHYRRRVEDAQLPDEVRRAALSESRRARTHR